VRAVPRLG